MNTQNIRIARIYTLEGSDHLDQIVGILQDEEKILGVTVIRGIEGYGRSGFVHTSSLLNLSMELPIIIEFYDESEKTLKAIESLKSRLDLKHIVSWKAEAHIYSDS